MQTRYLSSIRTISTVCCLGACLLASPLLAQQAAQITAPAEAPTSNEPVIKLSNPRTRVNLIETFTKVIELGPQILRVDGFDPNVLQVSAISPTQIRLQALTQGVTQVTIVDENEKTYTLEIFVEGDVRFLQATINKLFPQSSVEVFKVQQDSVVLRGFVAKPEQITRIVDVAEQFYANVINQMDFGGEQQILLKIKVMEVQRAKLRKFGFNFLLLGENGYLASTPGQLTPLASLTATAATAPSAAVRASSLADSTLTFGLVRPDSVFNGFLEALKKESLLKIYSNTSLMASNGRPANILAGGEFPILVPQSLGTVSVEYRPFGTSLEAVPILLGNGRVRLELQPEVSETDFANAVTLSGTTVPAITTRRVNTQVEMNFGETLVIAGLLANRDKGETHKVPFFGELPYVGAAFRREQFDEGETELIIMVTPEVASPLSGSEVPEGGPGRFTTTPTDREFILDGMLEVPKYGDDCDSCTTGCSECVEGSTPVVSSTIISNPQPQHQPLPRSQPQMIQPGMQQLPPGVGTPVPPSIQVPSQAPSQAPTLVPPQTGQLNRWRPSPTNNLNQNSLISPTRSNMIQPVSGTNPVPNSKRRQTRQSGLIAPSFSN